jgi:hypothetical protein
MDFGEPRPDRCYFHSHLSAMDEFYVYIFITLRISVLEEGFEIGELVQGSAGTRFDPRMKLAIDADVAKEAECHDEEQNMNYHPTNSRRTAYCRIENGWKEMRGMFCKMLELS